MSTFVGVAVPGRPVITSFQDNGAGRYLVEIANPAAVPDLCVFLTQPLPQPDMGVSVYYGVEGNWQFLGAVHNQSPTVFLRTGWPLNSDLSTKPSVTLGLAAEPAAEIVQKMGTGDNVQKLFAKKVALNLFRFIESFNIPGLPVEALERWYSKFEDKFNKDPSFVLRTE